MAINLATKNSEQIAAAFTSNSYVAANCGDYFDFTGVKGLRVYTPLTVELTDYTRTGTSRYGIPTEMQDNVQEMVMTQDKGFALTVDKGNDSEQMGTKQAGKMLKLQIAERVVPMVDKYALKMFLRDAGTINTVTAKPTKANIIEEISKASQALDDQMVPSDNRFLAVSSEIYSLIRLAPEFVGVEALGALALAKGVVGELFGAKILKLPTSYLEADCYFMMWHKSSVLAPNKISNAKVHLDPPGISGSLLEGRWLYDAFVVGARSGGVCALVKGTERLATPTIATTSSNVTITCTGADKILYTLDGSDPRYSQTAVVYGSAVSIGGIPAGNHLAKAVGYKEGKFTSPVATSTFTR